MTADAQVTAELLRRAELLPLAVVSDILDSIGLRDQVMAPRVRPIVPEMRVTGRARTVRAEPVDGPPADPKDNFRMQLQAIESQLEGSVMVVSTIATCFWGELLSIASRNLGATGIVIDGYTRDAAGIIAIGYPVFATGIHMADALGRIEVVEFGTRIKSGDVPVDDGDLVMGDRDGVLVVPAAVAGTVIERAEEKLRGENLVRVKIEEGMVPSEAYRRYGIL